MTRIRQFANDMGISYNKAKNLVQKGKKRRDGGSTILENYMPIKIVAKKKQVAKPKMRPKKDPFRADKTKSLNEKFSMETAKANEKAIKEIKKAMGGLERYEEGGVKKMKVGSEFNKPKKKKEDPPRYRQPIYDDPEIKGRGQAPLPPRSRKMFQEMRKKDGGAFPDLSGDGKVTQKDILIGRGVIKKKMGGIARGGGAAIQGTGFKGVY